MSKLITVRTSDEISMEIDFEVIKCSIIIRNMIASLGFSDAAIPIDAVDSSTMQLIFKWADHHKEDPPVPDDYDDIERDINDIPDWDKEFLKNITQIQLLDLIRGTTFLNIPKLSEYCYKTVASLFTGKTSKEMCETFGLSLEEIKEKEIEHDLELPSSSGTQTASNKGKTEVPRFPSISEQLELLSRSDEEPASKKQKTEN